MSKCSSIDFVTQLKAHNYISKIFQILSTSFEQVYFSYFF